MGATVPWAEADVGALASQALSNRTFGARGLAQMRAGERPEAILRTLLSDDARPGIRQVAAVDAHGRSAVHTGGECPDWAGAVVGDAFVASGNTLVGPAVLDSMASTFQSTGRSLSHRLVAALAAGQRSGGDRRGMQSAALLVVRKGWGYGGSDDRYIDLRVDEHPTPIGELARILEIYRPAFRGRLPAAVTLTPPVISELQVIAQAHGLYVGKVTGRYDEATRAAVHALVVRERLDERWRDDGTIDEAVLAFLRDLR